MRWLTCGKLRKQLGEEYVALRNENISLSTTQHSFGHVQKRRMSHRKVKEAGSRRHSISSALELHRPRFNSAITLGGAIETANFRNWTASVFISLAWSELRVNAQMSNTMGNSTLHLEDGKIRGHVTVSFTDNISWMLYRESMLTACSLTPLDKGIFPRRSNLTRVDSMRRAGPSRARLTCVISTSLVTM